MFSDTRGVDTVADGIKGKVWEVLVSQQEADKMSRHFCVVNLHHENGMVRLRIVHDCPPTTDATVAAPSLEDLFLYHFRDEMLEGSDEDASKI